MQGPAIRLVVIEESQKLADFQAICDICLLYVDSAYIVQKKSMASSSVKRKLVVAGGNGFLGDDSFTLSRAACVGLCKGKQLKDRRTDFAFLSRKQDLQSSSSTRLGCDFYQVGCSCLLSSIYSSLHSRSGEPTWSAVTSSPDAPPWSREVSWHKADVLKPSTYASLLEGADAVVHSMGILLEADYKGVLQGKESPVKGLRRAFSSTKFGTQNPLEQAKGADASPQEPDGQLTYEVMNRDSAVILAREAAVAKASAFCYISAAAGAPVLPQRYITTKRDAESTIASKFPLMRSVFLRPGMLYDSSRSITLALAGMTGMGFIANSMVGGRLTWLMGAGGAKPLKADVVAEAAVEALDDDNVKGTIEVPEIESLANTAWRKGML